MPENSVFDSIRNVLTRIEEIKRTCGRKGDEIRGDFENRLNEQLAAVQGRAKPGSPTGLDRVASGGARRAGDAGSAGAGAAAAATKVVATGVAASEAAAADVNQADGPASPAGAGGGSLDTVIRTAAERFRIPEPLIKAVIRQESGFNRTAVSNKGAMGLMQLMPGTADALGVGDPFDAEENILGGTRYLRELINLYGGNLNEALSAYNAGPDRVKNGVPDIPETRDFVESVLGHYERYSSGSGESTSAGNGEEL